MASPPSRLGVPLDSIALQTPRAHIDPARVPVVVYPHPLEVGKPSTLGLYVGVAHPVSDGYPLAADTALSGQFSHLLSVPFIVAHTGGFLQYPLMSAERLRGGVMRLLQRILLEQGTCDGATR